MKIRTGFVSNSSSSSFIGITTLEDHERIVSKMSELEKKIVEDFFVKQITIFSQAAVIFYYRSDSIDYFDFGKMEELMSEEEKENYSNVENFVYETRNKYKSKARFEFKHSEDF